MNLLTAQPPITGLTGPALANTTFALWMYVNQWPAAAGAGGAGATVFEARSATGDRLTYRLSFPGPGPTLRFAVQYGAATSDADVVDVTDYFPLQKWVHVAIVVSDRTLDFFLDGKLQRSAYVSHAYTPNVGQVVLGSGIDCTVANFTRDVDGRLRAPADIQKAYYAGTGMASPASLAAVHGRAELTRGGVSIGSVSI